jgi:hypothetical protein
LHKTPGWPNIIALDPNGLTGAQGGGMADNEGTEARAGGSWAIVVLAWLPVTLPLLWGIWQTVKKAAVLFR